MCLYKVIEFALQGSSSSDSISLRKKKKTAYAELNLALGNLINYYNQFQKYYCNYLDE